MKKPEFIARQGRRPSGALGHVVARVMAAETRIENARTLDMLDLQPDDAVLEIGCGHGETLARAARMAPQARLAGADFSEVMHGVARRRNREAVGNGRMELVLADSRSLPFEDARFNKVFAVHTIYFWSEMSPHLTEALRVMRPGGQMVLGYRPAEDSTARAKLPESVYRLRPVPEVEAALTQAGFVDVRSVSQFVVSRLMSWTHGTKPGSETLMTDEEVEECA